MLSMYTPITTSETAMKDVGPRHLAMSCFASFLSSAGVLSYFRHAAQSRYVIKCLDGHLVHLRLQVASAYRWVQTIK